MLMVSFEVVFQVLSLVFPAIVSSLCSLLMKSFEVVFLVLRFTKFEQFFLIAHGKLSTGVSSSEFSFFSKREQVMLLTQGKLTTGVSSCKG